MKIDSPLVPSRREFLALGLAQAGVMGLGPALAKGPARRRFVLYDGFVHPGHSKDLGLTPCNVVYQHKFFPRGADRSRLPHPLVTKALGEKYGKSGHFTSLDLELYHGKPYRMEWYRAITRDFRSTYGDGLLSHYQTVPAWLSERTLRAGEGSSAYRKWQAINDRRIDVLGDYINVFSPAQYAYGAEQNYWERRARAYAAESRRLNPQMLYVPYITYTYHQFAGKDLATTLVPRKFWRRQLEILYEIADGVIIWGGPKRRWEPSADWWLETRDFMSERL